MVTLDHLTQVAEQPLHRALGLTDWEADRIRELLGRDPNHFELAVFSLLWSEHCGYKHSAPLLRRLPSSGERVLQGPGENAGVLDLGQGLAVAFKVESHNHPSAVEPFQGAATGVGGILRDIIAMGARPVALLDGLWFGKPDHHFSRAVGGIGHYGNCLAADERVMYRNSGRVRDVSVRELVEDRTAVAGPSFDSEPTKPFEVLSIDPETHLPAWRPVARLFKRQAPELLRLRTQLGRTLTVTPDHPVMVATSSGLVARPAAQVKVGERLPMLCALPTSADQRALDLIETTEEAAIVQLPQAWRPSKLHREALRSVMPRADARHYWLSRQELPLPVFRTIEPQLGVERTSLRLRLPGPRSTSIPAILPLDEDTARLIGYYIAEGCCSRNGTTEKIIWTFGRGERDRQYASDVTVILGRLNIRHAVEERASTIAITVSSRILGRLLSDVLNCGRRSHEKRIPSEIFASAPLRWAALRGIFRGDGSLQVKESSARISHSTTSAALHDQLLLALQAEDVIPSTYRRRPSEAIQGRHVSARPSYALEITAAPALVTCADLFLEQDADRLRAAVTHAIGSRLARPRAHRAGPLATVAVTSIEPVPGQADVYDFEVPGTHLFVTTGGIVTHNCVGVPNVGGATVFHEAYAGNCLVNAMCVGLIDAGRLQSAKAQGPGNLVVLYGATTGRDGIGGASVLASQELGEDDADKRPTVQVGDPFTGKKLIEVSVELVESGLVESLQDCGAAGLASSLSEMAGESAGIDVHLDRVPLREKGMEPWEIMISESQERMVAVVRPQMLDAVARVCARWELACTPIGEVTETGDLRALHGGEVVGSIPARLLTDECPRYEVAQRKPDAWETAAPAVRPLSEENRADKTWVFEQYDQLVGSRTVRRPGFDAAVLRLRPSLRGIAVALQGPRPGELDAFAAGVQAVLGAARNVACAGGEPIGLTDCLNFGNPEKPEIGYELAQAIEGIAQAAEALGIPVVSGNVSLYNETDGRPIPPTPVVGCVGVVPDVRLVPGRWQPGDVVLLASAPEASLAAETALIRFLWKAAPLLTLCHDVGYGGLEHALAEAARWSGREADVELPAEPRHGAAVLAVAPAEIDLLGTRGFVEIGRVA